jgi:PAS domain S-box-containing protein
VFDGRGAISGYVAVMRDVTRREEAELERRRLAEALRHCTDSIEILDNQGRIVYVNAAFEAASGQRLADIRGSRPEALVDFAPAGGSYDDMMRTAYRNGRPWSGTLKMLDLAGELREEEVTVSPMRDERGQVSGYVVVKRDITGRRRMELQAQQRERLQSIGQLADGISHELTAPMQSLGAHLNALSDSFRSLDRLLVVLAELGTRSAPVAPATIAGCLQSADVPYLRREIGHILAHSLEEARQAAGIVQAMHEISHASDDRTAVDINRAMQSAITITASEWKPVADVRTEFDPELPAVHCLGAEIGLVLLNLLVNAAHAIGAARDSGLRAKGVITVATRRVADSVEIRVSDTGAAVSDELRSRLFDPQSTVPADAARQGLALAHDIITARHGGSIGLDSSADRGTTFTIRLPVTMPAAPSATVAA